MKNPLYLLKVEPDTNNNKYYKMTPKDDGSFDVEYGRVGQASSIYSYPITDWDKKLREKIRKGYIDQTRLVSNIETKSENKLDISDSAIKSIVNRLMAYAKKVVEERYTISSASVTQAMIDEAQYILNNMSSIRDINNFNKELLKLFRTIPRRMKVVSENFANNKEQITEILSREQDLLDVMKGQVQTTVVSSSTENKNNDLLESLGLNFSSITAKDKLIILESLGEISNRFSNAWIVKNKKTQIRFDKFLQDEKVKTTKLLWHGSLNENWWNILNTGLLINPPAKTTGKMFGYGIYFAPRAKKSLGYTSIEGSYWASGNSKSAFMSLYNVAYGNPVIVDSNSGLGDMTYTKLKKINNNAHSLHAKEGRQLKNDEIIVYQESQTTINYLVEIN